MSNTTSHILLLIQCVLESCIWILCSEKKIFFLVFVTGYYFQKKRFLFLVIVIGNYFQKKRFLFLVFGLNFYFICITDIRTKQYNNQEYKHYTNGIQKEVK